MDVYRHMCGSSYVEQFRITCQIFQYLMLRLSSHVSWRHRKRKFACAIVSSALVTSAPVHPALDFTPEPAQFRQRGRMGRKKAGNGRLSPMPPEDKTNETSPSAISSPRIDITAANASVQRDVIKVNNVNLSDLKNACDDVVKRVCRWFHVVTNSRHLWVLRHHILLAAFATWPFQTKPHAHRRETGIGLGKCLHSCRNCALWVEGWVREVETTRVCWCYLVCGIPC